MLDYEVSHPDDLEAALRDAPVAYVPLGTYEHHGWHLPVGYDGIKAHALCRRAAEQTGGVVFPTFVYGTGGGHVSYQWTAILDEPLVQRLGAQQRAVVRVAAREGVHRPGEVWERLEVAALLQESARDDGGEAEHLGPVRRRARGQVPLDAREHPLEDLAPAGHARDGRGVQPAVADEPGVERGGGRGGGEGGRRGGRGGGRHGGSGVLADEEHGRVGGVDAVVGDHERGAVRVAQVAA